MISLWCLTFTTLFACGNGFCALQQFINGNHQFTAKIFQILSANTSGNFLVSPLSAQLVLALTREGANGQTFNQLTTGLNLSPSLSLTHLAVEHVVKSFNSNELYQLLTANKIYVQDNFILKENFLNISKNIYKAGAEKVNFSDATHTVNLINNWVEEKTNNKIQNLLSPSDVNALTRLILINTLYFQGNWSKQFKVSETQDRDFHVSAASTKQVPTMTVTSLFNYFENNLAQYLELPYWAGDQNISMTIVLPKPQRDLNSLNLNSVFNRPQFVRRQVQVSLPRFSVQSSIGMVPILKKLGINDLFTGNADLSGIAGQPGDLSVSNVVQKTFINVTESGTEAAAATAVVVGATSSVDPPVIPIIFDANKEYLYYIHVDNVIIFTGRLTDPTIH